MLSKAWGFTERTHKAPNIKQHIKPFTPTTSNICVQYNVWTCNPLVGLTNLQETTLFVAAGFLPTGPGAGTLAASLMTWLGGATGITAGSTYAAAQSAAMGGTAAGVVATVGGMTVGGVLATVAVPMVAIVGVIYARG